MDTKKQISTEHSGTNAIAGRHAPAINSIKVLQTGTGEQHKEHRYGSWMPRTMWALISQSWVDMPLQSFLIQHQDGPVLFDTGIDPAITTDPNYISQSIGRFLLHRIFRLHVSKNDALKFQLQAAEVTPADIQTAVISHLHFDHIGGIRDVPNAKLLVSAREWAQLSEPHPEYDWVLREHIEVPGAQWHPIEFQSTDDEVLKRFGGAYDVLGDGSMTLIPTPGHTPGSLSMLVRSSSLPPCLLVGDLAYEPNLIFEDRTPGTGNARVLRETYANVRALKADLPNLVILASHDPTAALMVENLSAANGQYSFKSNSDSTITEPDSMV